MKVSEKSLELNVGAELLTWLRGPDAYAEGVPSRAHTTGGK